MEDQIVKTVLGIERTHGHLHERNVKSVAGFGLTWGQFLTLAALRQAPPPHRLLPSQLYGPVQVSSGGMTKILDGLQQKGLICREDNPNDRRGQFARLTAEGVTKVNAVGAALQADISKIFEGMLTEQEQAEMGRLVARLCQALEA
jgi:DNA-binding MarR family transcriptional regulator